MDIIVLHQNYSKIYKEGVNSKVSQKLGRCILMVSFLLIHRWVPLVISLELSLIITLLDEDVTRINGCISTPAFIILVLETALTSALYLNLKWLNL